MMALSIEPHTTIRAVTDQVSCAVEDETVILHLKDGIYFGLNPVGTFIWSQLKQPQRFEHLLDRLLAEFEVDREQGEADLRELIADLLKSELIEVVPESAV